MSPYARGVACLPIEIIRRPPGDQVLYMQAKYAELQAENAALRRLVEGMAERIYVQSNLLSRCAERALSNSKKV